MGEDNQLTERKKLPLMVSIIAWTSISISSLFIILVILAIIFVMPGNAPSSAGMLAGILFFILLISLPLLISSIFLIKKKSWARWTLIAALIPILILSSLMIMPHKQDLDYWFYALLILGLFGLFSFFYLLFSKKVREAFNQHE